MSGQIRAFKCFADRGWESGVIVFAASAGRARTLAYRLIEEVDDFLAIEVRREPDADRWAGGYEGHLNWGIDRDRERYRELGWHCDDDSFCQRCGLYSCNLERHEACYKCELCPECAQLSAAPCPECGLGQRPPDSSANPRQAELSLQDPAAEVNQ